MNYILICFTSNVQSLGHAPYLSLSDTGERDAEEESDSGSLFETLNNSTKFMLNWKPYARITC